MREKAKDGLKTFAVTADVSEATGRFQSTRGTGTCWAARWTST